MTYKQTTGGPLVLHHLSRLQARALPSRFRLQRLVFGVWSPPLPSAPVASQGLRGSRSRIVHLFVWTACAFHYSLSFIIQVLST